MIVGGRRKQDRGFSGKLDEMPPAIGLIISGAPLFSLQPFEPGMKEMLFF